jgi:Domain of unknown function (DUF5134)
VSNPHWLNDIFAAVMLAVALYSAGRLVAARIWSRPIHRDVDVAHALMGTAMAGMLVSDLNPFPTGAWEVVFSLLAAWFIWRCYQFVSDPNPSIGYHQHVHRLSRRLIHLVMALAMLYMYFAAVPAVVGSGGSMAMGAATGATANFVLLPTLFIAVLFASGIWEVDSIAHLSLTDATHDPADPALALVGGHPMTTSGDLAASDHGVSRAMTPWLAPRLEGTAHIAMCVTMGYMLVLML